MPEAKCWVEYVERDGTRHEGEVEIEKPPPEGQPIEVLIDKVNEKYGPGVVRIRQYRFKSGQ